jgi:1,4-dihydroxy-2-naphthoate octaprenyltransferase
MISQSEMKGAILLFIIICILLGLALVLNMAKQTDWPSAVILILVGGCSILAALFYTLGGNAYGYRGWGDLFAFLFFGPVPVIGTWFLHTHTLGVQPLLPAISLGLISTMILNVNNMRDIENDRASGKITIAVKLGLKQAKIYHMLMTLTSFICFALYNILYEPAPWYRYAYLIVFLLPFGILYQIRNRSGHQLDPYLKLTSLSGFLLAVAFAICINM